MCECLANNDSPHQSPNNLNRNSATPIIYTLFITLLCFSGYPWILDIFFWTFFIIAFFCFQFWRVSSYPTIISTLTMYESLQFCFWGRCIFIQQYCKKATKYVICFILLISKEILSKIIVLPSLSKSIHSRLFYF